MTQSYSQIVQEIETLKRKAETARAKEVAGVVQRMKEAIKVYGITAEDLGFGGSAARPARRAEAASNGPAVPKFADQNGNTWVGRGPHPSWIKEALAAGKSLQDFEVNPAARSRSKASRRVKPGKKTGSRRAPVPAKYKDDQGNTWSGRGSQPRWLVAALASGKKLESLAA